MTDMKRPLARGLSYFVLLLGACFKVAAQNAIVLSDTEQSQSSNFVGKCGGAVISVYGVTEVVDGSFKVLGAVGKLTVVRAATRAFEPPKLITLTDIFSDYNGVHCVQSKSGPRLLIWTQCGGSNPVCAEPFYTIIDPVEVRVVAPRSTKEDCDVGCAKRLLGGGFPESALPR